MPSPPYNPREPIDVSKLAIFLRHLREVPNVSRAARLAGHGPDTFRKYKALNPEFSADWDAAIEEAIEGAEAEVHRRAFEGVDKPLVHQGSFTYLYTEERDAAGNLVIDPVSLLPKRVPVLDAKGQPVVATVKEYSDGLATFLLKAHRPDRYRERVDMNVSGQLDIGDRILAARKRTGG